MERHLGTRLTVGDEQDGSQGRWPGLNLLGPR
jgi:hypothetical protein